MLDNAFIWIPYKFVPILYYYSYSQIILSCLLNLRLRYYFCWVMTESIRYNLHHKVVVFSFLSTFPFEGEQELWQTRIMLIQLRIEVFLLFPSLGTSGSCVAYPWAQAWGELADLPAASPSSSVLSYSWEFAQSSDMLLSNCTWLRHVHGAELPRGQPCLCPTDYLL